MTTARRRRPSDGALALKWFDRCFGPTWAAWRAWVCAVFGVRMTKAEQRIYKECTGRTRRTARLVREVWNVIARRAGKSRIAGWLLAFFAAVKTWKLAPGERPVVALIGPSRSQASIVLGYTEAFLQLLPGITIVRRTVDLLELSNGVTIMVMSASFRLPRGWTIVAAVFEEIAFLRSDESANPDTEVLRAIRPSLASVPGSLLVAISSPYAARGELYRTHEKYYGRDDADVLVWQSSSRRMNPTIPQAVIDREYETDPASAAAEWGGQFRADLEQLFVRAALDACTARGRFELAPAPGVAYTAFVDVAGGSGADEFAWAVAYRDAAGRPVRTSAPVTHWPLASFFIMSIAQAPAPVPAAVPVPDPVPGLAPDPVSFLNCCSFLGPGAWAWACRCAWGLSLGPDPGPGPWPWTCDRT